MSLYFFERHIERSSRVIEQPHCRRPFVVETSP
jgi:hypothetical protein